MQRRRKLMFFLLGFLVVAITTIVFLLLPIPVQKPVEEISFESLLTLLEEDKAQAIVFEPKEMTIVGNYADSFNRASALPKRYEFIVHVSSVEEVWTSLGEFIHENEKDSSQNTGNYRLFIERE